MPYRQHIQSAAALVTSYADVRAGFLKIALEKNRYATPYVNEAKALQVAASVAKTPDDLLHIPSIQSALVTASGISDKALNYLTEADQQQAVDNLIKQFLDPAGTAFVDELVFRFLLIRGDSLGGKMRNLTGKIAEQIVIDTIVATLSLQKRPFAWLDRETKQWLDGDANDPEIGRRARGICWQAHGEDRTLLFNLTVPFVGKNVDLVLLNATPDEIKRGKHAPSAHHEPTKYMALGELKGGIDPAGADEHWKTARSALVRVRGGFDKMLSNPALFFIGAAIADDMAKEIYRQLQDGNLVNAANLTNEAQLLAWADWLVAI